MGLSKRMNKYEAPEGYVYDWAEPELYDRHLYVKFLFLSKNDNINRYQLVKIPEGDNNA